MFRNTILINLGLLLVIGLAGWRLQVTVDRFRSENDLAKVLPVHGARDALQRSSGLPAPPPARNYSTADFSIVPAQNLFSDTRGKDDKADANPIIEAPKLDPRPIMVGMTISGSQRFVSIIDPTPPPGAQATGRRSQIRRVGDVYRGWTITDIADNQMVLESGLAKEIISLYDNTRPKAAGGKTPIIATRVINFAPGGSGGLARVVTNTAATSVQAPAPAITTAIGGAAPPAGQASVTPGRPGAAPNVRQVPGTGAPQQQAPAAWNEQVDPQGRRVIRTPFGDIPRKDPPQ